MSKILDFSKHSKLQNESKNLTVFLNYKYENFFLQNDKYKISLNYYNVQIDFAALETAWKALLAVFLTKFYIGEMTLYFA